MSIWNYLNIHFYLILLFLILLNDIIGRYRPTKDKVLAGGISEKALCTPRKLRKTLQKALNISGNKKINTARRIISLFIWRKIC